MGELNKRENLRDSPGAKFQFFSPDSSQNDFTHNSSSPKLDNRVLCVLEARKMYSIIDGSNDVTPNDLTDDDYLILGRKFSQSSYDETQRKSKIKSDSNMIRKSASYAGASDPVVKTYTTTVNLDDIAIDHTIYTESSRTIDIPDTERAPSGIYLPSVKPLSMFPSQFSVTLHETETIFLYELPCISYEKGTPESAIVEQENEFYQYITSGKGRNRKTIVTETQTKECISQSRHTNAPRPGKQNAYTFASSWDMYDTYAQNDFKPAVKEQDDMVMYEKTSDTLLRKKKNMDKTKSLTNDEKEKSVNILMSPSFYDAVILTDRVLANNIFLEEQKLFRGLYPEDPLKLDLEYKYSLKPLWIYSCEETSDIPAIALCINMKNMDIIAVAYGQFFYEAQRPGFICIWSIKNPGKPERLFKFKVSVTSVAFSRVNPNWLACGFYDGNVVILDITSHKKKIVAQSTRSTNPCFEAIWIVDWRMSSDKTYEYVIAGCKDGRINMFTKTKTNDFTCTPMMRLTQVESQIKGIWVVRPCNHYEVPVATSPSPLCYLKHPTLNHVYYIGTNEGCVHKCSTNYLNQHMDVSRCHVGPVYSIQTSPFWNKFFATCGADWAVRLWIEGIDEPIITLESPSVVYSLTWCPNNSSILVVTCGLTVYIWDIRRKLHKPSSEYKIKSSSAATITFVTFDENGKNMIVGANDGLVHTFAVREMPIPPFYQMSVLQKCIRNALITRPNILRLFDKMEK